MVELQVSVIIAWWPIVANMIHNLQEGWNGLIYATKPYICVPSVALKGQNNVYYHR